MTQYVIVSVTFNGIHNWPDAPKEVGFLQYPHRHKFYITLSVPTTFDRQYEFFILQDTLTKIINTLYGEKLLKYLGPQSCETIGKKILEKFEDAQEGWSILVSEDDENGAQIYL